jgi:hypothetical protein
MDGAFQNKCFGLPDDFDCDSCHYNVGFQTSWGGVVGPCGQQNCWYSCTACMYNNGGECYAEDIVEDGDE